MTDQSEKSIYQTWTETLDNLDDGLARLHEINDNEILEEIMDTKKDILDEFNKMTQAQQRDLIMKLNKYKKQKEVESATDDEKHVIWYVINNVSSIHAKVIAGLSNTQIIRIARILLEDAGESYSIDSDGWLYHEDKLLHTDLVETIRIMAREI